MCVSCTHLVQPPVPLFEKKQRTRVKKTLVQLLFQHHHHRKLVIFFDLEKKNVKTKTKKSTKSFPCMKTLTFFVIHAVNLGRCGFGKDFVGSSLVRLKERTPPPCGCDKISSGFTVSTPA